VRKAISFEKTWRNLEALKAFRGVLKMHESCCPFDEKRIFSGMIGFAINQFF